MENIVQADRLLSRREVAKRLSLSIPTIIKYTRNGTLPAVRVGGLMRWRESDIINAVKPTSGNKRQEGSSDE